jgi:hypothetical protein
MVKLTGTCAAGKNADGRLEVFAIGDDGVLYHIWQTVPNATLIGWSAWAALGNGYAVGSSGPAVGVNADGRLEVFAEGSEGYLYHAWQTAPNGTENDWSTRAHFPALAGGGVGVVRPAVAASSDGRMELFGVSSFDGTLQHVWQVAANNGWSHWFSHGPDSGGLEVGNVGPESLRPVLGAGQDGRLELFATGSDGNIYHIWQTAVSNGWSAWDTVAAQLGVSNLALVLNQDGRLSLFAVQAGDLYLYAQTAPNNGWAALAPVTITNASVQWSTSPVAARGADGRLRVFGADQFVFFVVTQKTPGAAQMERLSLGTLPVGGSVATPEVALNADLRLALFAIGPDGVLYHTWEVAGEGWSQWTSLGAP